MSPTPNEITEALERVRDLHFDDGDPLGVGNHCGECRDDWPCAVIVLADAMEAELAARRGKEAA